MLLVMEGATLSLAHLASGRQARIESVHGGRGFVSRLAALGFVPGQEITMVQNYRRGPIIVVVKGARVALGRGEADRIIVQEVREASQ